jgi:hypothetical protein
LASLDFKMTAGRIALHEIEGLLRLASFLGQHDLNNLR